MKTNTKNLEESLIGIYIYIYIYVYNPNNPDNP